MLERPTAALCEFVAIPDWNANVQEGDQPGIDLVAITGYGQGADVKRSREAGFQQQDCRSEQICLGEGRDKGLSKRSAQVRFDYHSCECC